jgi:3alpha(or 20beta)-hydroxysteroid dehydrogenase
MSQTDFDAVPDFLAAVRLQGRGFVVLGAGQGIGRQTCHALAQAGARILCVDRDAGLAEKVATEVGGHAAAADIVKRQDMVRVFAEAKRLFGERLGGVIDIVGIADLKPLSEMDDEAWSNQFDLNVKHAFLAIQLGAEALPKGGGSMVFVSSLSGTVSVAKEATYSAAKAALNHLVRCAAHELGPRGIRVNAVAPGFIRTPRLNAALSESFWQSLTDYIPLGRAAHPADVAKTILFLASELSSCITGAVVPIDGGVTAVAALPEIPIRGKATGATAEVRN